MINNTGNKSKRKFIHKQQVQENHLKKRKKRRKFNYDKNRRLTNINVQKTSKDIDIIPEISKSIDIQKPMDESIAYLKRTSICHNDYFKQLFSKYLCCM